MGIIPCATDLTYPVMFLQRTVALDTISNDKMSSRCHLIVKWLSVRNDRNGKPSVKCLYWRCCLERTARVKSVNFRRER